MKHPGRNPLVPVSQVLAAVLESFRPLSPERSDAPYIAEKYMPIEQPDPVG